MKPRVAFSSLAGLLLLATSPAEAIVVEWDYSINNYFSTATYTSGGGTTTSTFPAQSLSWGVPSTSGGAQSSLVIGNNPINGSLDTYLGATPPQSAPYLGQTLSLTHHNHVITSGSASLLSATLESAVLLTPADPLLAGFNLGPIPFTISFTETSNTAGTCAAPSPAGNPCNDIFVLSGGLLNFSFDFDAGDGDGLVKYFINIFPTSGGVLSTLNDAACFAAGAGSGCIGFSTPENQSTTLAFGFTISTNRLITVPEPGMLGLLGLGLLAMAAMLQRRSRASMRG
jgi:hypothetical protein